MCCSTPFSMCYWACVSFLAWAVLSGIGIFWYPLHATSAATSLLAAGIGCAANGLRNRTFHCSITAPVFLAGGAIFLLGSIHLLQIQVKIVWLIVGVSTCLAFLLEWWFTSRRRR